MKILIAVTSPGPAESLIFIANKLLAFSHKVVFINASNDISGKLNGEGVFSGVRALLLKSGLGFIESDSFGKIGNYHNIGHEFACAIIKKLMPDVVLTGTFRDLTGVSITLEDALIRSAKEMGIPAFQFVDMWDNWFPKKTSSVLPDIFLLQDEFAKRIIKKRSGVADERCVIVGNPAIESFLCNWGSRKMSGKPDLELSGKRVIAYFGQCPPIDNETTLPWVVNSLRMDDVLIFRRHPKDQREFRGHLSGSRQVVQLDIPAEEILNFTDICVTHSSTIGLKAALVKIKTINIILENESTELIKECNGYPLALSGGSLLARTEMELKNALADNSLEAKVSDGPLGRLFSRYGSSDKITGILTSNPQSAVNSSRS